MFILIHPFKTGFICLTRLIPTHLFFSGWVTLSCSAEKKIWCAYLVVVVICSEGLGQPKVTDFGKLLLDQQDVTSRQVSVHKVLLLQILHSHRHLVHQAHNVLHSYGIPMWSKTCFISYCETTREERGNFMLFGAV